MPGRPLPRADAHSQLVYDPRNKRTFAGPTPGSTQRANDDAVSLTDRRISRKQTPRPPCVVSPDEPVIDIGWFWFDMLSTAENP